MNEKHRLWETLRKKGVSYDDIKEAMDYQHNNGILFLGKLTITRQEAYEKVPTSIYTYRYF
jgi:hypothetical protein